MNNITSTNKHWFCRTCLSELQKYGSTLNVDDMYNVHRSQELSQWIVNCLPIPQMNENDCLPKFVCTECYEKLQCFYKFRAMAIRSMQTLTEILGLSENGEKNETLDWWETPNEDEVNQSITPTFQQIQENYEDQDVDDKNLVMRTLMESGQYVPEIYIEEQKLQFPTHNFVYTTMPAVSNTNTDVQEGAIDSLDIDTNKATRKRWINRPQPISSKFQCIKCFRSYASQENLDAHMRTHQGLRPFQCTICERSFNRAYHLRRHMERVHLVSVQKRLTKLGEGIEEKNKDIKEKQKVVCDEYNNDDNGNDSAEDDEDYKIDDRDVSNEPKTTTETMSTYPTKKKFIYQCKECNRFYASEETRAAHMRTHQGLRPFPCTKCTKSFTRAYHLQKHTISAHTEKVDAIVCRAKGCDKSFRLDDTYRKHYRLKHSDTPPQRYICEDCGRVLSSATALREHRYIHGPREEHPYHCKQCDRHYSSQRHFKEHMLRHTGPKRFVCPYCGMRKTTRYELTTHINYHTKEKQWKCPICPSVFNNRSNMKRHNNNIHMGLRAHVCRFCNESFAKIDTLRHHEMRHTGEKPNECHICKKRFIQLVALKAHMKTHAKF